MISLDEYRALLAGAGVIRRADRGRLVLTGADRLSYLHGLLTNDVESLRAGQARYAALLTAQGRMISDMRVFELGEKTLIDLDGSLATSIHEHLDKFVITEEVAIEDGTSRLAQIGVYGPESSRIVSEATRMFSQHDPIVLPSEDLGVPGFDVVIATEEVDPIMDFAKQLGAIPVSYETCECLRVEAGVPKFLVDMDTTTIPLEAGIEGRAISMTKGCYVGQEVIVRVLHRGGGRVAKKLVGVRLEGEVARGDKVTSDEREIGVITSAVVSPRFGPIALGYVHRDFVDPGTLLLAIHDGGKVSGTVTAVPFTPIQPKSS
jgi:tRNA-modifying protein YgfZ